MKTNFCLEKQMFAFQKASPNQFVFRKTIFPKPINQQNQKKQYPDTLMLRVNDSAWGYLSIRFHFS